MSIDLMKGDLVRHAQKGPGVVEETAGYGDSQWPRCSSPATACG